MAKNKMVCTRCTAELVAKDNFYKSNSEIYKAEGRIPTCKKCLNELYDKYLEELKSDVKALYKLAMKLDVYFDYSLFETSRDNHESKNTTLPIYYMSKIGLNQFKDKTFFDSGLLDIWSKDKVAIKIEEEKKENKDFEVTREMIDRWGKNKDIEDYAFLESRYKDMMNAYGDKNISSLWDYQVIATNYLRIKKLSEGDDKTSIDASAKLMSENAKLMKDCEMKSSQQKSNDSDRYSKFIERIEFSRPICEPAPFFKDTDRCEEYFGRFVKQPLEVSLDLEKLEAIENWEEEFDTFGEDEEDGN